MTIAIKPTASGSTIEQNGSTILTVDSSGNIAIANDLTVTGTFPTSTPDALSTASGSAPSYSARAWVSLDGVSGTPNIDASGNISSITDNGVGDYTLNFTTAMSDNLYALVMSVRRGAARVFWVSTLSTSSARVIAANLSQTQGDEAMSVVILR